MKKTVKFLTKLCLLITLLLTTVITAFAMNTSEEKNYDQILGEYLKGNKNEDYMVKLRKELVETENIQHLVDENYFLLHDKLDEIEGVYLPDSRYSILLNLTSEEEFSQMDEEIYNEDAPTIYLSHQRANGPTYNNNGNTVSVSTGGYYYYGPVFTISNCPGTSVPGGNNHTVYGYCARKNPNGNYDEAPNGAPITRLKKHPNDSIFAKALYYGTDTGYNYAASRVSGWSGAGSSGRKMVVGNTTSWALGHDHYARYLFNEYYNFCKNAPAAPETFEAYEAEMNGGRNQTVSFGYFVPPTPKNGYAQLKKTSANPDLTNGSDCYSLAGAEYGIYSDQSCTKKVKSFTTDANGNSNKVELKAGDYWVKETKAPKGYALDKRTYKIKVVANQTAELKVTDIPTMDPVGVLLGKIDKETNQNKPQGSASLENAHFEMKFYKGLWQKDVDPATLGKTPVRKWVFKTDNRGFTNYDNKYLVSGDSLYSNSNGTPMLPIGTVTIQEVKAPEGYQLNPTVYTIQITDDDKDDTSVHTYNMPTIPEAILKLDIVKKIQGKEIVIPGTVFTHTKPDGSKETCTTDSKGQISIKGLERGKHTIEETSVPGGFVMNPGKVGFTVTEKSEIQLDSDSSTDETGKMNFSVESDGNGRLIVEDVYAPYALQITKENDQSKRLEGAEFTLYADKGCSTVLQTKTTGKDGILKFTDLKVDTLYYLKETKAPKGYRIPLNPDGTEIIYEIKTTSNPVEGLFEYFVNGKKQSDSEIKGTPNERIVNLKVVNYIGLKMPKTGTNAGVLLSLLGIGFMAYGICVVTKRKK